LKGDFRKPRMPHRFSSLEEYLNTWITAAGLAND